MSSADTLRRHMERMRLSRQDLADAVGVSREAVRQWLAGGGIRGQHLGSIAKVLRLDDAEVAALVKGMADV